MTTALLSVLEPIPITGDILVSSTVPETLPVWDATKTYATGNQVRSPTTNKVYESEKDGNLNHDPTLAVNQSGTPPWWSEVEATNRWLMFDNEVNTQTVGDSPLTVVLRPGPASDVYLAGLDADQLYIEVRDKPGGTIIFQTIVDLEASAPGDYDEYFWGDFKPMTDYIVSDIDPYYACEVKVTLTKVTGQPKCGLLAVGRLIPLGFTLADAEVNPRTFSYIDTNEFGKTKIVRRNPATDMDVTAVLQRSEASTVVATLQRLQDVPCAWIASSTPDYAGLRGFGLGSGRITYNGSERCTLRFTMRGLI